MKIIIQWILKVRLIFQKSKGGLDVPWLVVYTAQDSLNDNGYEKAYENAINKFDAIHRLINDYSDGQLSLATSSSDVYEIIKSGKKLS